jgi:hypothetical protein
MLRRQTLLGGLLAATLLATLASPAVAARLSISTREWVATWREVRLTGGFGSTTCSLTLEGELHSKTIAKTRSSLIGYIIGAATGGCGAFPATVLRETLPWHIQYESFTGTLPNITTAVMKIIGFAFRIRESFGIECLFRSTEARPLVDALRREASGAVRGTTLSGTLASEACGLEFSFAGDTTSFTVPPPPAIRLTLI